MISMLTHILPNTAYIDGEVQTGHVSIFELRIDANAFVFIIDEAHRRDFGFLLQTLGEKLSHAK